VSKKLCLIKSIGITTPRNINNDRSLEHFINNLGADGSVVLAGYDFINDIFLDVQASD